jgi:heterodisulfide reductase subunit B2
MKYLYYPGCCCTMKATGRAYDESLRSLFKELELQVDELNDWNCCGSTLFPAVDEIQGFVLAARNFSLAKRQAGDSEKAVIITPCTACYQVLQKAQYYLRDYPEVRGKVQKALKENGLEYAAEAVAIRHPLDVLVNDYGLDRLRAVVVKPLEGLKVCCYYGCLMVRPYSTFDDPHNPQSMDRLMTALGAKSLDWGFKARCCGGSLMGTLEEIGIYLSHVLLEDAQRRSADVIATGCPFCQTNLECFQKEISKAYHLPRRMPVVFFSQLLGLALGIPERNLGLHRIFVPMGQLPVIQTGGAHV